MTHKRQLYRNPGQGKIAGVCAGVAEFTGTETWLVRIIWLSGFLLSGGFFLVAYIACWFILDKKHSNYKGPTTSASQDQWHRFNRQDDIDRGIEVKSKVWQAGEPPKQAFRDIVQQFDNIESRVRSMEYYVTSNEFALKREIEKLK